ncbi:uncharacterized protein LOC134197100 [Corticium candelabrum]|uniref:uncharacterized protein LOC134197100 n=1 Tax=Corticium candelabrum TaxID=121492 RepID=UPI002E270BB6|nr:uncharacterized protein LOC134197100 [Corticium candelabrum]
MGQCRSSVFCPMFRKEGNNRYTEFLPSKNWRYADDHIRSQLQGQDEGEDDVTVEGKKSSEDEDDLDAQEDYRESSGLLEERDEDNVDRLFVDHDGNEGKDIDEVDRFEVECITIPPQPKSSDNINKVHRPADDLPI